MRHLDRGQSCRSHLLRSVSFIGIVPSSPLGFTFAFALAGGQSNEENSIMSSARIGSLS
jgi:hypothetical protein